MVLVHTIGKPTDFVPRLSEFETRTMLFDLSTPFFGLFAVVGHSLVLLHRPTRIMIRNWIQWLVHVDNRDVPTML